jgi:HPt (histidine-containing phosphotransfer) domain-containing protein
MNGHVTKPIDPAQLFGELAKWVAPRHEPEEDRPAAQDPKSEVPSAEVDLPETLTGFDLDEGLARLQGNRQLYRKLILTFADSCREGIEQIETAIAEENYPEVLQQAHSIKGSAGNLAAKDVQAAAMALEHLVKHNPDAAPPADALFSEFEALQNAADILFASIGTIGGGLENTVSDGGDTADGVTTEGIPAEDRKMLAARIKDAAEMGDMTELQAIAADLDSQMGSKQSLSRKIIALADAFDLDGLGALAAELDSSG